MSTTTPLVENSRYAAFTRRILRAYARRIYAGDIDALTGMTAPAADIEDATRQAVTGRRGLATPGPRSPTGSASPARPHSSAGATRHDS